MRELNVPFQLENVENAWVKAIPKLNPRTCQSLEHPETRCIFRFGGQCTCDRYGVPRGACSANNREDRCDVIFVITGKPEPPRPTIKGRCKKAPNEYTTEGKEYNLEKLEPSGYHRYKDDLGDYSYITEEISSYFDI